MHTWSAAQIRESYLRFFEQHGHAIVPSSSLVIADDPTLLFANSGMVQFKNLFLGQEQRPYRRATTAQKCLRVSGKHNDLEEVGPSPRHHTFFEMLGNFSFGDYFKAEAIAFAWELLTGVFALPVERLWFTVFAGNERVPADDEAARLWEQVGAPPDRILRFGEKDNFWVMADTGPCGPCSEITMYLGDDPANMNPAGVNSDDPDYVEIWNLVFMQFERSTMQPLPRPSVDTGMGLERMAMVLQGVHSTYETDIFTTIIEHTMHLLGSDTAHERAHRAAYRAVADHARAIAFLITDGVLPGNNGRSYVLRRILRRAAYQGRLIGFERPFLAPVVERVISTMSDAYPDLQQRRSFVLETVDTEEQQFLRTLSSGLVKLDTLIDTLSASGTTTIPGDEAFRLKDTDGFPLDLTQKIAEGHGMTVDTAGFDAALTAQRERSRAAAQFKLDADADLWSDRALAPTNFVGYTALESDSRVVALVVSGDDVSSAAAGQQVQVVLDTTPFYAESGGQVGDTGTLTSIDSTLRVRIDDTQRPVAGLIVHYGQVEAGTLAIGDTVRARINTERRADVQRNHTATHLLHQALHDVVGDHARQAGSLVAPDRLRFDFTHTRALTPEQVHEIERRINAWIRADAPVDWQIGSYQDALNRGATALFGEKYGDQVRSVHIPCSNSPENPAIASKDSLELCGGTHVARTGEIGFARVVGESSIGSGLRRVEVLTGRGAETWVQAQSTLLHTLASQLGVAPANVLERVSLLLNEQKEQQKELETLRAQRARNAVQTLLERVQHAGDVAFIAEHIEHADATRLRDMGDWLRDKLGSGVVVLAAVVDERPQVLAMITPDLVQQGYHAGNLVKALAHIMDGGGGGRPDMAQAGGRNAAKLTEALASVAPLLAEQSTPSA